MSATISAPAVGLGLVAILLAAPVVSGAQVLEIGEGGEVTVYDRPAVFDSHGATPIQPVRASKIGQAPRPTPATPALSDAALAAQISPDLLEAVAWRESRFQPGVVSRSGAIGEMQLMPGTARSLGVDPYDTRQNYRGGAAYLRVLMARYDGDLIKSLAAYNAGPGAVDRWGGMPPYKETRAYVAAIMDRLSQRATSFVQANAQR
jgi:soluble lytic murein transglycosylase-like protein